MILQGHQDREETPELLELLELPELLELLVMVDLQVKQERLDYAVLQDTVMRQDHEEDEDYQDHQDLLECGDISVSKAIKVQNDL